MRTTLCTTAIALAAGAAFAQDAQQQQQAPAQGSFVEMTQGDMFATQLLGLAVMAPEAGGNAAQLPQDAEEFTIDVSELSGFVEAGQVTDVMMSRTGEPRALIVALGDAQGGNVGGAAPDVSPGMSQVPGDATMPMPGTMPEIAVNLSQVLFLNDETAPQLMFAVIGIPVDQLQQAPLIDRGQMVGVATGPGGEPLYQPGWRGGRTPFAAPSVTAQGYTQVPVTEVSLDNLMGADVYGTENENIGSIGDVVLNPEGEIEYATVDVGGFLGIGSREVAIGFEEMTILRDAGWNDVQVHIAATEAEVEQLPEYQATD